MQRGRACMLVQVRQWDLKGLEWVVWLFDHGSSENPETI